MKLPVQITFRNIDPSPAVETDIRARAEGLERFFPRLMACRVVVETDSRRQHQGRLYHIRVDLTVPGREIVVNRDPGQDHGHEDIYVAVHDAFDAVRRQLEDHARTTA